MKAATETPRQQLFRFESQILFPGGIMCRLRSLPCFAKLWLAVALVCVVPAFAQDPPNISLGMTPSATYHSGEFDFVDTATGRLNLHIPLFVDHSQRGGLNFTYSLTYTSTGEWSTLVTGSPGQQSAHVEPPPHGVTGLNLITDGWLMDGGEKSLVDRSYSPIWQAHAFWVQEANGSLHPVSPGVGRSIDGSGIEWEPLVSNTIINKEGVQFSVSGLSAEDTNGNEITFSGGSPTDTMTDTLGRSWTTTVDSSDITSCPTGGPVAPTTSTIWTIRGPANFNNGARAIKFCYSVYTIVTSFNVPPNIDYTGSATLMTGVVLPDGTTWRFDYNNNDFGDLKTVYTPTGGSISYSWLTTRLSCGTGGIGTRTVASRTIFDGTNSNIWHYNWSNGGFTVTDPMQPVGNDTVYTGQRCTTGVGQIKYYSGPATTGTLLKTDNKTYRSLPNPYIYDMESYGPGPQLLSSITTVWPNGQQSQTQLTYDSGFTFNDTDTVYPAPTNPYTSSYGLVTVESHSDYGSGAPGPIISTTNRGYLALTNSSYAAANILDLPSSVVITDGSGNSCSEADYGYDESSTDSSGVTEQHVAAPNSVRGNLTSIKRQLFQTLCSSPTLPGTPPTTTNHVYDTGMIHTSTDPLNNPPTTYSYSGTYYGAFPTSICNPLNQCTNYGYDFNTGLVNAIQDPNDLANSRAGTTYTYDDMLRPLTVSYPDGGEASIVYNYSGNVFAGDTVTKKITSSLNMVTGQTFDGLGRLKQTQTTVPTSTCSGGTSYVDTTYDGDGRQFSVSNPYCTTGDSTYGVTSTYYDALNRVTSVVEQDGGTISTNYTNFPCKTVTDEAGKARTSCTDGAGRLTSVREDPNGLNYQTSYTYDALDNLLSLTQSGSRQRSFISDTLSRLIYASNPESGPICIGSWNSWGSCSENGYDANGNVLRKTDNRSITTTYSYDALNRITMKTYSNGDPTVTYAYDGNAPSGCSPTLTITNPIGRRTGMCDAAGNEAWSYDPMGRVLVDKRTTNSVPFSTTYGYNLDGSIATLTDPSQRTITYTPNVAAQPVSAVDTANNMNYVVGPTTCPNGQAPSPAGAVCYAPQGAVARMLGGQNLITTSYFNSRLQPCRISVNSNGTPPGSCGDGTNYGNVLDYNYNFNAGGSDNGNVIGITNNLTKYTSTDRSQQFYYDGVNRILQAGTVATSGSNCWGEQYGYDNWGNLLSIGQWSPNYNGCTQESGFSITPTANNQISGFCYDAAGNLLAYSPSPCTPVYTYNAENQLTSTAGVTYTYDGDGKRVEKSNGILYWYGTSGDPLEETNASGNLLYEYIFFNGKRIARRDSLNNVQYYFGNHLGSATVMTESNGVVGFAAEYYPFGQERDDAQATNYLQESNAFDQSPWQTWDVGIPTITPNATTAPDGTLAEKVSFPAGSYSRRVQDFNSVVPGGAAGQTFTYSIWMRADAPLTVRFDLEDEVSGNYAHTSGIVNVTNQWQQFSVTRTIRAGASDAWAEIGNHYNDTVTTTFYAWGAQVSEATLGISPGFKFTGKERDSESGLDDFGARYNSSQYGRFMSPDWSDDPDPVPYADFTDPQTLNLYAYVRNNPLSNTDDDGHDRCDGADGGSPDECQNNGGQWIPGNVPRSSQPTTGSPQGGDLNWDQINQSIGNFTDLATQVTGQVVNFVTAPRNPGCMANATIAGSEIGAGVGLLGLVTGPGDAVIDPTAAAIGGAAGYAVGMVSCMSGTGRGGGGGKGGGHREKTRGANAKDREKIRTVAREAGIDVRKFGDYVEKLKPAEGRGPSDNYTLDELRQLAEQFKAGDR